MPETEDARITLRLPPHLHRSLTRRADQADRSLNWYIVHLLDRALVRQKGFELDDHLDWDTTDEAGSCGFGYDLGIRFNVPRTEPDAAAYAIRDEVLALVEARGTRDLRHELWATRPLEAEETVGQVHD